jgi:hypothetical protein
LRIDIFTQILRCLTTHFVNRKNVKLPLAYKVEVLLWNLEDVVVGSLSSPELDVVVENFVRTFSHFADQPVIYSLVGTKHHSLE